MPYLEKEIDFRALFESAPGLYLVLLPDLTIVGVSDAYASATMTKRDEIVNRNLFEVFPDNPDDTTADGAFNLRASLNFVLKNKTAHTMALQKYDIRRRDGTFEVRYWSPLNKPVLNDKNEVAYIIHRVEDVTDFISIQKEQTAKDKATDELRARSQQMEIEIYTRSKEIQKLNAELEQKVAERTAMLEGVNKDVSDYKFALDESCIVAVTDQKGIIQHVNDNFCKISKYSREELIGQDHRIINSKYHSREFIRNLWVTIANGKIWRGELRNIAKDGTIYWVDTTIVPFLNDKGKPYKYLAIRADITQRKRAENRILKLNEELESKVKERTLELTRLLEREQANNEMKSRFVSIASHEFRTPLAAILSSVSLIEEYKQPEQEEKRQKHINRIISSVRNLIQILNDFLSLSQLEKGVVNAESEVFNLDEFLESLVEEMEGYVSKKNQHIKYEHTGNATIEQSKKILKNIIINLLSNASKYSHDGKEISLISSVSNGRVTITVKDHGIGIPEDAQKKLFSEFFRAENVRNIEGTGLGLSIVKKYVEFLDGNISFISKPGEGTSFTVEFPQKKAISGIPESKENISSNSFE
ncbi:MAG: ATP-binding protein [Bacteroidia bacterium]